MSSESVKPVVGHGAKAVHDGDPTPGIATGGYGATLYIIVFGSIESSLSYTLEDSADNVTFAPVSGTVNGVHAGSVIVEGQIDALMTVYVKHSAVRRYHRLIASSGAGDNYASVAALKLEPSSESVSTVDYFVGS